MNKRSRYNGPGKQNIAGATMANIATKAAALQMGSKLLIACTISDKTEHRPTRETGPRPAECYGRAARTFQI